MKHTILINLLILVLFFKNGSLEYNKLEWSVCEPSDIDFVENILEPMPIMFPDPVNWRFKAVLKRLMDGPITSNVTITRGVNGITLPIRCYLINGEWVGSCVFPDLCRSVMYITNLNRDNCPKNFKDNGIDCTCPFNIPARYLELEDMIPTYSPAFLTNSWLLKGDYNIKVKASDKRGHFFCLNLGFTVNSRQ